MAMVIVFFLWVGLYRYPVFELVYPQLRQKILLDDSKVYSSLPGETTMIRVVKLKPGQPGHPIESDLANGPLENMNFEALSYVWGATLWAYSMQVNDKPFAITDNLYCALKELRYEDRDRPLWIDAVSINQRDDDDKSFQFQLMRDIYAKSSRVVVWLDKDAGQPSTTFRMIHRIQDMDHDTLETFWKDRKTIPSWRMIHHGLSDILEHKWWTRAWIIQEIVVAQEVVIQ
ncbi:hypothetical protein NX059_010706 [Plenodomus lindquistii]|nr:hypothetical protein NX059_010706 [Plenodomus lindquistii]